MRIGVVDSEYEYCNSGSDVSSNSFKLEEVDIADGVQKNDFRFFGEVVVVALK